MGISDHILIARRERERRALEAMDAEPEPEEEVITDLDDWFEDEPEDEDD